MDDIDRAILYHLQHDGRLPNTELAELVGLSPSPCLRRVRSLEDRGIIDHYEAVLDPATVGRAYEILVWVTLSEVTRDSLAAFEHDVARIDGVVEAHRMMGQPDYLLRVAVADIDAFEELYMGELTALPFVQILTSQATMKTVKRIRPTVMLPNP